MLYGIIDIGSNTIRLSVYDYSGERIVPLINKKYTAGLISYVRDGEMSRAGIEKACETLKSFRRITENFRIENVFAFATASLRNITNTEQVVSAIEAKTGFSIRVLSGKEEAETDFYGATALLPLRDGLLVDIGGGSTELVPFRDGAIQNSVSLPVGALNSYHETVRTLFPSEKELWTLTERLEKRLNKVHFGNVPGSVICGVGGSIRAFFKLYTELHESSVSDGVLPVSEAEKILQLFMNDSDLCLKTILNAVPDRVHTVMPGLAILCCIARFYTCDRVMKSDFGVKEGFLLRKVRGEI